MTAFSSDIALHDRVEPTFRTLVAVVIGIGLAIGGFSAVRAWEDRSAEREFATFAEQDVHTLQHGVDEYVERLVGLRGLFYGADEAKVSRRGFETFANELMQDLPGLMALSWSPRVLHADRDAHEQSAGDDGVSGYRISALDTHGKKSGPREPRADYYPVFYSTLPLNARAYGIDLQDGGVRQRPLDSARDTDAIATSENLRLQSGRGNGYEFYAVLPVYRPGAPHDTLEDRRASILGFVRATFQFHQMVNGALRGVRTPADIYVFESRADGSDLSIYARRNGVMSDARVPRVHLMSQDVKWLDHLRLADRQWDVIIVPKGASNLAHYSRAWLALGASLLITLMLAIYIWTSARYVQKLKDANMAILEQAHTDALTGLSNRRDFVERLEEAVAAVERTGGCFAVHFIDLDGFKEVNDTYGHPMGDALLQQVGERIRARTRGNDVAARLGGDEFAVLQNPVASPSAASVFAERLVESLAAPYAVRGVTLNVTASLGTALQNSRADGPASLIMHADLALYSAKSAGRNCVRLYEHDPGLKAATAEAIRPPAA